MPQADLAVVTFFIDRSLGSGIVAAALRDAGEDVVTHDSVFEEDTADTTWLAEAGNRSWVVLTKDARIRTNQLEREALLPPVSPRSCSAEATCGPRPWRRRF